MARGRRGFIGWDPSGTKLLRVHNAVLCRFTASDNQARGLWLDTDNAEVAIGGAVIARNLLDGIFLEANQGPLVLRRSYSYYNGRGHGAHGGLLSSSSDQVTRTENTFFDNAGAQIFVGGDPEREFNDWETGKDSKVSSRNWTINKNTVVGTDAKQFGFAANLAAAEWKNFITTLKSANNRWLNPANKNFFNFPGNAAVDLAGWRARTGQDAYSMSTHTSPQVTACSPADSATGQSIQ